MKNSNIFKRVFNFYYEGFRNMTIGKTLWAIILLKLFIMFAILKVFFFPNFIKSHSESGEESEYVATQLSDRAE